MTDPSKHVPNEKAAPKPYGWLLLRNGHAVPIFGLAPDDLKRSRGATVENPAEALKHLTGLNAIVDSLGFDGDFGDYQRRHWPELTALLERKGCKKRVNLFDRGMYLDMAFRVYRRDFADRYYLGPSPRPTHVFLGTVDLFERYTVEELRNTNRTGRVPRVAGHASFAELRDAVYANRSDLYDYWNFLGDQLIRPATRPFVQRSYFTVDIDAAERARIQEKSETVVRLFRRAIDLGPEGWVELIPVTEKLLLLRAQNGEYDFVWNALREGPPPVHSPDVLQDLPEFMRRQLFGTKLLYFDTTVWEDRDAHESELLHYKSGGRAGPHYPGRDELLRRYYESRQKPTPKRSRSTAGSLGLKRVEVADSVLAVSELVTIAEFQRFLDQSGYGKRRGGENIARANTDDPTLPACVTFDDALAYCADLERRLSAPVRLLSYTEHRAIRPNPVDALERRAAFGGLPEITFPTAVQFDASALDENGKLKWIEDYPPGATWIDPLPWGTHNGLRFIDAWDAAEWTTSRDHNAAVTINWDGDLPNTSWGAYKRLKTCFRVVVEVVADA